MKILFLTRRGDNHAGEPITYHGFEQAVSKITECRFAGEGWPLYRSDELMDVTVKRVMPDADWVIDKDDNLHNRKPQGKGYKVGLFVSDLHGKHSYGINNPKDFRSLLDKAGYHAVFYRYAYPAGTQCSPTFFTEIEANTYFMPWSVDTDMFKNITPWRERRYDVTFLGSVFDVYHLRKAIIKRLPHIEPSLTKFIGFSPPGEIWTWNINKLSKIHCVGQRYADLLDDSKAFIFGSSIYRYPILKYFEGRSAGCLVMADEPTTSLALDLTNDLTYIRINMRNWERKLEEYLIKDLDKAERVAKIGCNMVRMLHSHEARAKQFIEALRRDEER